MAFLIFTQKGTELGRWQLGGSVVIGRAPECDVCVHDILLSRRHCRVQPGGGGTWQVVDLDSKNGTRLGGARVTRQALRDGDILTIGKTNVRFHVGRLVPGSDEKKPPKGKVELGRRPADPFEALASTVTDFDAEGFMDAQRRQRMPTPQPRPKEPAAFVQEDLYSMLTEIASSSWDSIYATASRPNRPLPKAPPLARDARDPRAPVATAPRPATRGGSHPVATSGRWDADSLQVAAAGAEAGRGRPRTPFEVVARVHGSAAAAPSVEASARGITRVARVIGRTLESVRKWVAPNGAVRLL